MGSTNDSRSLWGFPYFKETISGLAKLQHLVNNNKTLYIHYASQSLQKTTTKRPLLKVNSWGFYGSPLIEFAPKRLHLSSSNSEPLDWCCWVKVHLLRTLFVWQLEPAASGIKSKAGRAWKCWWLMRSFPPTTPLLPVLNKGLTEVVKHLELKFMVLSQSINNPISGTHTHTRKHANAL